uniref:Protein kinase domain-containing protein n=1 Tax=Panagrolaimus sp. JU765 TaxID=591449 RepID=A0AC34PZ03_9BILA
MLTFDPNERITINQALNHEYLADGQIRFHEEICTQCTWKNNQRIYCQYLEPSHPNPINPKWEQDISRYTMYNLRDNLYNYVVTRQPFCGRHIGLEDVGLNPSFMES